ncbi:hypothetical protein RBTH_08830 [Bacillus thuringiensis serovar israelensis ATCC 35646]|nr:hypothetical protein RBTH_08830 [Bacillus thuringiensis serovar israelensis ATCC 35646]
MSALIECEVESSTPTPTVPTIADLPVLINFFIVTIYNQSPLSCLSIYFLYVLHYYYTISSLKSQ